MISKTYKVLLYISSFLPLYVILLIKFYDFDKSIKCNFYSHKWFYLIFLFLILISVCIFMYLLLCELNSEKQTGKMENMNTEVLSYFITYVVPLTTLEDGDINSILINLILFIVIGVFHVNSDQFHLNILFTFFGLNVFKDEKGDILITRRKLREVSDQKSILVKKLGTNIYIDNSKKKHP